MSAAKLVVTQDVIDAMTPKEGAYTSTCAIPKGHRMETEKNIPPSPTLFHWDAARDGWYRQVDDIFVSKTELTAFEKASRVDGVDTLRGVRLQDRLVRVVDARPSTESKVIDLMSALKTALEG